MSATLFIGSKYSATTPGGLPLAGGRVETYAAGSLTPQATYTSQSGASPNTNPVILDASGSADIWFGPYPYRIRVKAVDGTLISDTDNITNPTAAVQLTQPTTDLMVGDGTTMVYTLSANPATVNNVFFSLGGAIQVPGVDYTLSGVVITCTSPPPAGVAGFFNYTVALPVGTTDSGVTKFLPAGGGAVPRTAQAKLREIITPADFGAAGNGVTLDDAPLAAAFAAAKLGNFALDLGDRLYAISAPVVLNGYTSFNIYSRGAALIGPASGTLSCLLDIKNCTDVNVHGRLGIAGKYNTGLTCGVWIHADTATSCSLIDISSIAFSGVQCAYRVGDAAFPDKTVSEINIFGGYTYGCLGVLLAEGTQTVVNLIGCTSNSDYGSGGGTAWLALTQTTIRARGANVRVTGGEINHASNAGGATIDVQPVISASYGNPYGSVSCTNVLIESAAQLATASNPSAIASPMEGSLKFVSCSGYHAANSFAFIQTDAGFSSGIVTLQNCNFYGGIIRTQANVQCAAAGTVVYCDEQSFGKNFISQLRGIVGGSPRFRNKMLLHVHSPNHAIGSGVLGIVRYQTAVPFDDGTRYLAGYSTSTGQFTVPTGGLKDVSVRVGFNAGATTPTDVYVYVNGVLQDTAMSVTGGHGMVAFIKALNAGDIVDVRAQPTAGITPISSPLNHLKIMASN